MPLEISTVRAALPERRIDYFASTTTTMGEAARLAATGAPAGTLVLADKQTAGRGRMGRAWYSEKDAGLYFTLILRPVQAVPWLTLAVGLAVREEIAATVGDGIPVDIRWPNDILIGELKCAGILVAADGDSTLVGVGVNVNHSEFPPEIAELATSLRLVTGLTHSRESLLAGIIGRMDEYLKLPADEVRERFAAASTYAHGLRVEVEDTGQRGVTGGLDAEGFLLLQLDDGRVERIVAGGVRPIPSVGAN